MLFKILMYFHMTNVGAKEKRFQELHIAQDPHVKSRNRLSLDSVQATLPVRFALSTGLSHGNPVGAGIKFIYLLASNVCGGALILECLSPPY